MLKSFWWFEDNKIAGFARPGFNCTPWFELDLDEAILMGWLGQFGSGTHNLDSFDHHLSDYAFKIAKFYEPDEVKYKDIIESLRSSNGQLNTLIKVAKRTEWLDSFETRPNEIKVEFSDKRLNYEIRALKEKGIKTIVTLNELHHNADVLSEHFHTHHFQSSF